MRSEIYSNNLHKSRIISEKVIKMKINETIRNKLNAIVQPYTGWHYDFELNQMYDELRRVGVDIDNWYAYDRDMHEFSYEGEPVENSRFVLKTYQVPNSDRTEYTIYFS